MNLDLTPVATSIYKDLIRRLWAGIDSVNSWSHCIYWMTLKPWWLFRAAPLHPLSLIEQVHHLAMWTFDVGLQCCSSAGMTHMFVWDWNQSSEKIPDPMVCGLLRVSVCLPANKLDPCDTHPLRPTSAPGLTGLPPSQRRMKVSYFPPLRQQYKVHHNIKQLFHPTPHPSGQCFPLMECSAGMLKRQWTMPGANHYVEVN